MSQPSESQNSFHRPLTPVLVFAVAGRIGSGASFVKDGLVEELRAFGYEPVQIDITKLFLEQEYDKVFQSEPVTTELPVLGQPQPFAFHRIDTSTQASRIKSLQQRGNDFRSQFQPDILAALAVREIRAQLQREQALERRTRIAYLIDSLKHPDEVDLLRGVFGDAFCMVGVVADDNVRQVRLKEQKHIRDREFEQISEIDADEKIGHGQQALRAILKSDYFFANNSSTPDEIVSECRRLLNLVFNSDIVTPRADEFGMHVAHMAADKSACLSRQVGAAIVSENGDLLATGSNDVPEFGGGLYTSESARDERCFVRSGFCYNDDEKRIIADEILAAIRSAGFRIKDSHYNRIKDVLLNRTRLKMLIEFSRAVHAEMDAIITVARAAALGLVGSTLYVTTYPCHNCAKHIIDAGIRRVVFLEPYVKSLAQKLHSDAINNPLESPNPHKVMFDNYGGVAPDRYAKFFSIHGERKKEGKFIRKTRIKDTLYPITAQEVSALKANLKDFDAAFAKVYVEGRKQGAAPTSPSPPAQSDEAAAGGLEVLEEIGPANSSPTAATVTNIDEQEATHVANQDPPDPVRDENDG